MSAMAVSMHLRALGLSVSDIVAPIAPTHLVSKSTHASPDWLLNNIQTVAFIRIPFCDAMPSYVPVYPAIDH